MVWTYNDVTGAETDKDYYLTNHQGSVVATADAATGLRSAKFTYDAYGNIGVGEATGQPFRYTGRRYDEETGLYYYRARYYHPGIGRFMQTDPMSYADQMNMYGYVSNDPVNAMDPSGMITCNLKQTKSDLVDADGNVHGSVTETSIDSCEYDDDSSPRHQLTKLALFYAAHKLAEFLFVPEEGDAFESQMQEVLANGAFPDGILPNYAQSKWLYINNTTNKPISVDGSVVAPVYAGSNILGSSKGGAQHVTAAMVFGREKAPYETSGYNFTPVRAKLTGSPLEKLQVFFRNELNQIAILEHGTGYEFDFVFR